MGKDQEQELARLGLEPRAQGGEEVIYPTTAKRVKGRNTDRSDVNTAKWTKELEKAEKRRFPWWLLVLLLVGCLIFWVVKGNFYG